MILYSQGQSCMVLKILFHSLNWNKVQETRHMAGGVVINNGLTPIFGLIDDIVVFDVTIYL